MTNSNEDLSDDSLPGDAEWEQFWFVTGFQEKLLERNSSWHISQYEEAQKSIVEKQNATDNRRILDGIIPEGYLRLERAVRRFVGLHEDSVIWNKHPGWLLLGKALKARNKWPVKTLEVPDRREQTGNTLYVFWPEFEGWAKTRGDGTLVQDEQVPVEPAPQLEADDCILNPPVRKDVWFKAIRNTVSNFVATHRRCPDEAELWSQLWDDPPAEFKIKQGKDKGENALMLADKPLDKEAFRKRWERYTRTIAPTVDDSAH